MEIISLFDPAPIKVLSKRSMYIVSNIYGRKYPELVLMRTNHNGKPGDFMILNKDFEVINGPSIRFNLISNKHLIRYIWRESIIKIYDRDSETLKWELNLNVYYPDVPQFKEKNVLEYRWIKLIDETLYIPTRSGLIFSLCLNESQINWILISEPGIGAVSFERDLFYVTTPGTILTCNSNSCEIVNQKELITFKKSFWKSSYCDIYHKFWVFEKYLIFFNRDIFLILNKNDLSYYNSFRIKGGFVNTLWNLQYHQDHLYII